MQLLPDLSLQAKLVRWSRHLTWAVIVIASLVLTGWQFDIEELTRPLPRLVAMNPLTAICFILTGIAGLLITSSIQTNKKKLIARSLAVIVLLASIIKLTALFIDFGFQIDKYLFSAKLEKDIIGNISNSMAPNTAFCFAITSIALFISQVETPGKRMPSQYLALIIALTGWLSILGYIYQVQSFYGLLSYIPMAFHTAVCFLCVSLSILFMHPGKGLMSQFTSLSSGSLTARLLAPAAVIVPSALGLLRLHGHWTGIVTTEFGAALFTLAVIIIFLCITWYIAFILNRRDVLRKKTEDALRNSQEEIAAIFNAAPDAVIVIDNEGRIIKWNPEAESLFGWSHIEATGKLLSETIIPVRYREAHKTGIRRFLQTEQSNILGKTIEIKAVKKNTIELDVALRIAPVSIKDNNMFVGFVRDITEQKKTDQKLKRFNEELAIQVEEKTKEITQIFERLTDGFIALDKNFCYTYLNKKAGELIHKDPASLIGKNVWEVFPDAIGSATYKAFNEAMANQQPIINTDHYEPLSLWQENHIYPSAEGLSVFIRDITKRKIAEIALQQNEEKYRTFVEEAVDAILVISPKELRYVEANKKAAELLGYSVEELLQLKATDLILPDDTVPLPFARMEAGEAITIERRLRKKDGEAVAVETSASKLPDGNYLAFIRNITERKKAEQQISDARKLADKLIDSLPGVFYFYDETGKFIRWNRQFEIVTGYSGDEIAGMHPIEFFGDDEKEYITERITDVFKKGINDAEANFVTKNGDRIPHYFKAVLINYQDKPCLLGSGIDITERKLAEEEMQRLNEELRKLTGYLQEVREEERTHIAREIHDELGQQLTVLKMDVSWLSKKIGDQDEALKEKINGLLSMINATVTTVRRIAAELRPSLLDDLGLIPAMEWHLEEFEKRSGIHTTFKGPQTDRQLQDAVKIGLFRIFQESLTNVARHADAKEVNVNLNQTDKLVILSIIDDGLGFDQTSASKKTLGILGMKERTLMLGGEYKITGIPGRGTSVLVSVPLNGSGGE